MSFFDFNNAQEQTGDLIPANTIAKIIMTIKPGGQGEGGYLKSSGSSDAMMLDCEFTIAEGPHARRKFWQYMVVSGGKLDENGASIAGKISRSTLRAILESARNIRPDDASNAAMEKRRVNGWQDFDGIEFVGKIGVERDKTGKYSDRNRLQSVITPDSRDYQPVQQQGGFPSHNAAPQQSAPRTTPTPAWAR